MTNMANGKGIITKVGDAVKSNAGAIGFLVGLTSKTGTVGAWNGLDVLEDSVKQAINGNLHFPNLEGIRANVVTNTNIWDGLKIYFGAEIVKYFDLPIIAPFMNPLQKLTMGMIGGQVAQAVVFNSTHSNGGSSSFNGNGAGMAMQTPSGASYAYNVHQAIDPNISPDIDVFGV